VFTAQEQLTPGFIASLREALGMTQTEFGRKLNVSKMTVSRWECGRIRPSPEGAEAIRKLQAAARRRGVMIGGERRTTVPTKLGRPHAA
jgi:DNA-binding transcriptional regulator YiaG